MRTSVLALCAAAVALQASAAEIPLSERRSGYDLIGRGGVRLKDHWANGLRTLHGMHSHGFPNCFVFGPQQAGFTVNFPHLLDEQSQHVAYIVKQAIDRGLAAVEVSAEAEAQWVETIIQLSGIGRQFLEDCTPGYYNNEGKLGNPNGFYAGTYGEGSIRFGALIDDFREGDRLPGVTLR